MNQSVFIFIEFILEISLTILLYDLVDLYVITKNSGSFYEIFFEKLFFNLLKTFFLLFKIQYFFIYI